MNYVPNQSRKILEETLAGFISDTVKTTLKRLLYFKMTLPLSASSLKISPHSSVTLSYRIESIGNGSVD